MKTTVSSTGIDGSEAEASGLLLPPWNSMTLPALLSGSASLRADAPLVRDADDVETLAHRPRRHMTSAALRTDVDRFARQLRNLGLGQGEVVILHLPNTVEAAIALLGVQAAGGIPAPVPVFESVQTLRAAVELTGAAAMVSLASFAGLHPSEQCRSAAAHGLSVRFLADFSASPPPGVVSLANWDDDDIDFATPLPPVTGRDAALITFDSQNGVPRALMRSHEQIVAEAAAAAAITRLGAGSRLLVTIPPATVAGVVFGIALPLLTGASVDLNALFDSCGFAAQMGDGAETTVILPGPSEAAFAAHLTANMTTVAGAVFVHRAERHEEAPRADHTPDGFRIVDVTCLGEALMAVEARGQAAYAPRLPGLRNHPVPEMLAGDGVMHRLTCDETGQIRVGGALTPLGWSETPVEFLATDHLATVSEDGRLILTPHPENAAQAA